MTPKPDSIKQAIAELTSTLGMNETYLAGFLGVTEKSLNDWKKLGMGNLTPKARRLVRLYEVVSYLNSEHREIRTSVYKSLIENGRLITDPSDEEEGSMSLLNFIIEEPSAKVWTSPVEKVVQDFISDNLRGSESVGEANRSIREAR